jgi:hypothetical protein
MLRSTQHLQALALLQVCRDEKLDSLRWRYFFSLMMILL